MIFRQFQSFRDFKSLFVPPLKCSNLLLTLAAQNVHCLPKGLLQTRARCYFAFHLDLGKNLLQTSFR